MHPKTLTSRTLLAVVSVPLTLLAPLTRADENADWWSFLPLAEGQDKTGANLDIDAWITARLEDAGLDQTPATSRANFLRRASFGLTGLPPTLEEIRSFVEDESPVAHEKVIDRLLASPHYGERWARHWLDVARYSDSNGLDENVAHGNAWRFRDYVIAAFQNDTPYDEFVIEQVAGDLLALAETDPQAKSQSIIATGFLSFGPKVLTERDPRKLEMDIIDEQLDTLGKAVLGLTLGCARCHDHKFDPISTEDYYGLAAIFKGTRTMRSFEKMEGWFENDLPGSTKEDKRSAMGVTERETVARLHVNMRGDPNRLGKEVPRAVPVVLANATRESVQFPASASGRLELAHWMVSSQNPLTPRVIVNRIWRWHFGKGIVDTPDNFGLRGSRPSHPRLLDALASSLIREGWSLKSLHRRLLLSRTYRADSRPPPGVDTIDPENRLLSHFPITRLDAESLRDAMLAVSGQLDRGLRGSLLTHVKNRGYLFDHTSKDKTSYASKRRSIYLPIIRNHLFDGFQLFDYPDPNVPSGDRSTTTTAPQSLYLLNSDSIVDIAAHLATRTATADSPRSRIRALYRAVLLRDPDEREVARASTLVAEIEDQAWETLAHALLISNEFIYLR